MDIRNEQMKQVVWLSGADSAFFESVCFVLRKGAECYDGNCGGADMLAEADRIVSEYVARRWNVQRHRGRARSFRSGVILGAVLTAVIAAAVLGAVVLFA